LWPTAKLEKASLSGRSRQRFEVPSSSGMNKAFFDWQVYASDWIFIVSPKEGKQVLNGRVIVAASGKDMLRGTPNEEDPGNKLNQQVQHTPRRTAME
jgi:hypothetical protein